MPSCQKNRRHSLSGHEIHEHAASVAAEAAAARAGTEEGRRRHRLSGRASSMIVAATGILRGPSECTASLRPSGGGLKFHEDIQGLLSGGGGRDDGSRGCNDESSRRVTSKRRRPRLVATASFSCAYKKEDNVFHDTGNTTRHVPSSTATIAATSAHPSNSAEADSTQTFTTRRERATSVDPGRLRLSSNALSGRRVQRLAFATHGPASTGGTLSLRRAWGSNSSLQGSGLGTQGTRICMSQQQQVFATGESRRDEGPPPPSSSQDGGGSRPSVAKGKEIDSGGSHGHGGQATKQQNQQQQRQRRHALHHVHHDEHHHQHKHQRQHKQHGTCERCSACACVKILLSSRHWKRRGDCSFAVPSLFCVCPSTSLYLILHSIRK